MWRRALLDESGQMAVELAVLMPVVIVVALTVFNLARFVGASAVFDRVAAEAVTAAGVAPSGAQNDVAAVGEVRDALARTFSDARDCTVEVQAEQVGAEGASSALSLAPRLTRFRCTLWFRPWPASFVLAGVAFDAPLSLRHEHTVIVDRFRTGVVR